MFAKFFRFVAALVLIAAASHVSAQVIAQQTVTVTTTRISDGTLVCHAGWNQIPCPSTISTVGTFSVPTVGCRSRISFRVAGRDIGIGGDFCFDESRPAVQVQQPRVVQEVIVREGNSTSVSTVTCSWNVTTDGREEKKSATHYKENGEWKPFTNESCRATSYEKYPLMMRG